MNETDTIIQRTPVTGVMDLLFTTNGCIDILGGVDIQFMLSVRSSAGETVDSPISIDAAKQIFLTNCGSEDEWLESFADAVKFARKLREEDQVDQAWRATYNL